MLSKGTTTSIIETAVAHKNKFFMKFASLDKRVFTLSLPSSSELGNHLRFPVPTGCIKCQTKRNLHWLRCCSLTYTVKVFILNMISKSSSVHSTMDTQTPNHSQTPNPSPITGTAVNSPRPNSRPVEEIIDTSKLTSVVWGHFLKIRTIGGDIKAKCKYCQKELAGNSNNGTTHLKTHMGNCIQERFMIEVRKYLVQMFSPTPRGRGNSRP
ncbi:hypothetical protein LINPERPRIM_LOCUS25462 [Linum perenne]